MTTPKTTEQTVPARLLKQAASRRGLPKGYTCEALEFLIHRGKPLGIEIYLLFNGKVVRTREVYSVDTKSVKRVRNNINWIAARHKVGHKRLLAQSRK